MNKILEVYNSIVKWKKSDEFCAKRIGMDLTDYIFLKRQVYKKMLEYRETVDEAIKDAIVKSIIGEECPTKIEFDIYKKIEDKSKIISSHTDVDSGKVKLEAYSSKEPKTPEEIIEILNIDTTKWKLSQYWNKQKGTGWLISALVTQINKEESDLLNFYGMLSDYKFPKVETSFITKDSDLLEKVCGILSLQDLHFGKPGNESMSSIAINTVNNLLSKCRDGYDLEKVVIVLGGDTLQVDTFNNTTTKGTPVEASMSAQDAYIQAFEGLYLLLSLVRNYANNVHVMFIPGNHDRLSSFHLVHALSQSFGDVDGFTFSSQYSERKVMVYGENMFCFEHGDVSKKMTPLVYATEHPYEWGQTSYRTLFTGHLHTKKTTEFVTDNEVHGFTIKVLPSLSATDYWHYHNKFTGNKRAAVLELYNPANGKVAEFNYNYKL
jgi:hypothetical protein